jgi:hypothetical protein
MTTGMPPLPPSLAASSRTTIGGRSSVPRNTASVHYTLHNAPTKQQQQQHSRQSRSTSSTSSSSSSSSSVHSALHRRSFSNPRILRVHSGSSILNGSSTVHTDADAVDTNGFSPSDIEHFYPLHSKPAVAVTAAAAAAGAAAAAATAAAVNGSTGTKVVAVAPIVHVHHHGDDDIRM